MSEDSGPNIDRAPSVQIRCRGTVTRVVAPSINGTEDMQRRHRDGRPSKLAPCRKHRDKPLDPPPPEAWDDARSLSPTLVAREPELISDGGGLPFAPGAIYAAFEPLDPNDPKVSALITEIDRARLLAQPTRLLRPRKKPAPIDTSQKLAGWHELADDGSEVLFGRGRPPRLLTVAARKGLLNKWSPLGASNSRPLRATRNHIRASSWRLDPNFELTAGQTELRILVTEQTLATGTPVADRLLTPEIYLDESEVLVRVYVQPLEGYVGRSGRNETPVIISLPEPLAGREVTDGALWETPGDDEIPDVTEAGVDGRDADDD